MVEEALAPQVPKEILALQGLRGLPVPLEPLVQLVIPGVLQVPLGPLV